MINFDTGTVIHARDVEEIIGRPPPWLVRFGTLIVLFTFLLIIATLGLIEYPDYVIVSVKLSRVSNPEVMTSFDTAFCCDFRMPSNTAGGIKKGEIVKIEFFNYPVRKFGYVKAFVSSISLDPDSASFSNGKIYLSNGLVTSFNKRLPYVNGMRGNAKIVISTQSLLAKFLRSIQRQSN
jgi:hypothetical protein